MFDHFDDAFNVAKNHLYGIAAHEEPMAKRKPREAKPVNKNISEKTAKGIWNRTLAAYGVGEEEAPFDDAFTTWHNNNQGLDFSEWMEWYMDEASSGREVDEEVDDDENWLDLIYIFLITCQNCSNKLF